jgi:hypothetical protein
VAAEEPAMGFVELEAKAMAALFTLLSGMVYPKHLSL